MNIPSPPVPHPVARRHAALRPQHEHDLDLPIFPAAHLNAAACRRVASPVPLVGPPEVADEVHVVEQQPLCVEVRMCGGAEVRMG